MSNDTVITLCNRAGLAITELEGYVADVSWRLNGVGVATLAVTYSSAPHAYTRIGQYIVIQFTNGLPTFAGTIEDPLRRNPDSLGLRVLSGEEIMAHRRVSGSVSGTRGAIAKALLNAVNATEPTGLVPGGMASSGESLSRTYARTPLQDAIGELSDTQDWVVTPTFANRRLTLELYWYRQRGRDLSETVLLKPANEDVRSDVQGPIRNAITAVGDGIVATAENAASITRHGRREHVVYFGDVSDATDLQDLADEYLARWKDGGHRLTISRVGEDQAAYSSYDVGDIVRLEAFMDKGAWALDIPVRVLARSWAPGYGSTLEVEEWTG